MEISKEYLEYLMAAALKQAEAGAVAGEVPVGAVLAVGETIIATAYNRMESVKNATLHAEMQVIQEASKKIGDWRLTDSVLCVTLEPCTMCIGAARLARIPVLVYGAADKRLGACGSLYDLAQDERLGPVPRVISGVHEDRCLQLLKTFFQDKRRDGRVA